MNLANNSLENFPTFPTEFQQLIDLDLSQNSLTLEQLPEVYLPNLRLLSIGANNISSWNLLGLLLDKLDTLVYLNLSSNPLTSLPELIQSPNLKALDLSNCQIHKIHGHDLLQNLPSLETLILRGNPLHTLSDLTSTSLTTLDLSICRLTHLHPELLQNLPNLVKLNLAHNTRISLASRSGEYVYSESLKVLDLSRCNMDAIEVSGFPNLTTLHLHGNLIKNLRALDFQQNSALKRVELSANSITYIAPDALRTLSQLMHLDLSHNMIHSLDADTFAHNPQLTSINLSRNLMTSFSRLHSQSLRHLNVSWCEVLQIEEDALSELPELVELDLSNNLFAEFPTRMRSKKLQRLDLSMCR